YASFRPTRTTCAPFSSERRSAAAGAAQHRATDDKQRRHANDRRCRSYSSDQQTAGRTERCQIGKRADRARISALQSGVPEKKRSAHRANREQRNQQALRERWDEARLKQHVARQCEQSGKQAKKTDCSRRKVRDTTGQERIRRPDECGTRSKRIALPVLARE